MRRRYAPKVLAASVAAATTWADQERKGDRMTDPDLCKQRGVAAGLRGRGPLERSLIYLEGYVEGRQTRLNQERYNRPAYGWCFVSERAGHQEPCHSPVCGESGTCVKRPGGPWR